MNKLAAVIITKNEEDKIAKCLDSLKGWVDEIIIVDDLSADRTVEICRGYGAKVIASESKGNFDRQRNIGIETAQAEWILQMDADEIIPAETSQKILDAINKPNGSAGFKIRRRNFFMGRPILHSGTYGYALKIFKKEAAHYIGSSIHETLDIKGPVGEIDADINHYPFNSIYEVIARQNFYSEFESERHLKENSPPSAREIKHQLTIKPITRFWKLYVRKKGYKDGMHGFIWCILNVAGHMIRWMKIWEKVEK